MTTRQHLIHNASIFFKTPPYVSSLKGLITTRTIHTLRISSCNVKENNRDVFGVATRLFHHFQLFRGSGPSKSLCMERLSRVLYFLFLRQQPQAKTVQICLYIRLPSCPLPLHNKLTHQYHHGWFCFFFLCASHLLAIAGFLRLCLRGRTRLLGSSYSEGTVMVILRL